MAFSYMNIYFFSISSRVFHAKIEKENFDFIRRRLQASSFEDILEGGPFVCILVSFSRLVQDVSVAIDRTRTSLILQVV